MIFSLPLIFRCLSFWALIVGVFGSVGRAEPATAPAPAAHSAEQKALLHALDEQLVRFEASLAKDENASHAAAVKEGLETLKKRRDVFNRLAFDQGKYDELRFDLNVAYQRLNLWLAPKVTPNPKAATSAKTGSLRMSNQLIYNWATSESEQHT